VQPERPLLPEQASRDPERPAAALPEQVLRVLRVRVRPLVPPVLERLAL
jgi:hypothetical protein